MMKLRRVSVVLFLAFAWAVLIAQVSGPTPARRISRTDFAGLSSVSPDDQVAYCTNCVPSEDPCISGGGGSFAFRVQGRWSCAAGNSILVPGDGVILVTPENGVTEIALDDSIVPFVDSGAGAPPGSCSGVAFYINTTAATLHPCVGGVYISLAGGSLSAHTHESAGTGGQLNASNVFNAGTLPANRGGTGQSVPTDLTVLIGDGSGWVKKTIPDCSNTTLSKLLFTAATREFSCGTDQTGVGGGAWKQVWPAFATWHNSSRIQQVGFSQTVSLTDGGGDNSANVNLPNTHGTPKEHILLRAPLTPDWTDNGSISLYGQIFVGETNTVSLDVEHRCIVSGSADPSWQTAQQISGSATANVNFTVSGTITNACDVGNILELRISRNTSDANTATVLAISAWAHQ